MKRAFTKLVVAAFAVAFPLVALAQTTDPNPLADPLGFGKQIVDAVKTHNWLLAVPLVLIGLIALLRRYGAKYIPWLATNRGGATVELVLVSATLIAGAVASPGPHTIMQLLLVLIPWLLTNQAALKLVKKILAPTGSDQAQDADTLAKLAAARVGTDAAAATAAANSSLKS